MAICGYHMHKFSVSKDMKKILTIIKGEGEWLVGKVNGRKVTKLHANGRVARTLRPIATAPEFRSKSGSLLMGAYDWPSHQ